MGIVKFENVNRTSMALKLMAVRLTFSYSIKIMSQCKSGYIWQSETTGTIRCLGEIWILICPGEYLGELGS